MSRSSVHSMSLAVSKVQLEAGDRTQALTMYRCQSCADDLVLMQPDNQNPDRLLGSCPGCRRWSLIECLPDEGSFLVAALPSLGVADSLQWAGHSEDGRLGIVPARPRNQRSKLNSFIKNPKLNRQD
jgi:hypothetical protein